MLSAIIKTRILSHLMLGSGQINTECELRQIEAVPAIGWQIVPKIPQILRKKQPALLININLCYLLINKGQEPAWGVRPFSGGSQQVITNVWL